MEKSRRTDDQHRLQLMALLHEQVREQGQCQAADLEVDHWILTASPESERLTRWMRVALEDTRRKLTRQELLHRLWRVLSLGQWRK